MNSKLKSVPMSETMSKYEGQTRTGKTANSKRVAVGTGATAVGEGGVNVGGDVGGNIITGDAVHIDALGDVGDVITGTKLNLINHTAIERVASKRQIASPPDDYITRAAAEEDLKALLTESEGFRIIYLYGLPGVGKSWLARQVGKKLEDRFVDGTLWANLEQTKLRSAMWHFIQPYTPTINRNSLNGTSEFVAATEEAFGEKRILLVLDQLDSRRNGPKEWLPHNCPNCVVLLISQQPPPVLQANECSYQLSGMAEDEALQMFTHLLRRSDGSDAYDNESLRALAAKLDHIPAAIHTVARDITVKLSTPNDYLQMLTSQRQNGEVHMHLPGLETVYENLPADGKSLFPLLGILHSVPWTTDDLFAISHKSSREIEIGLRQLERAGLVDKRPSGHYHTPTTISHFAYDRLMELGGQPLVNATIMLRASDILQKAELVLRYTRQAMLKECWQDKESRVKLTETVVQQFSRHVSGVGKENEKTSMLTVPRDPLLAFFEDFVLSNQAYANRWFALLKAANFPLLRHQLEEMFDWALEQEDWFLIHRFATNINVNTKWMIDALFMGEKEEDNWLRFNFVFPLLKNVVAENFELSHVVLKAANIKATTWKDCQFIATEWPGAYIISSTFERIDMVGMVMPGGVITDCIFRQVDARYGDFRGTTFQKCTFNRVNFRGARLEKAKFIDCYFHEADFRLTVLEEAFAKNK